MFFSSIFLMMKFAARAKRLVQQINQRAFPGADSDFQEYEERLVRRIFPQFIRGDGRGFLRDMNFADGAECRSANNRNATRAAMAGEISRVSEECIADHGIRALIRNATQKQRLAGGRLRPKIFLGDLRFVIAGGALRGHRFGGVIYRRASSVLFATAVGPC
jgi:hypothetical protein